MSVTVGIHLNDEKNCLFSAGVLSEERIYIHMGGINPTAFMTEAQVVEMVTELLKALAETEKSLGYLTTINTRVLNIVQGKIKDMMIPVEGSSDDEKKTEEVYRAREEAPGS